MGNNSCKFRFIFGLAPCIEHWVDPLFAKVLSNLVLSCSLTKLHLYFVQVFKRYFNVYLNVFEALSKLNRKSLHVMIIKDLLRNDCSKVSQRNNEHTQDHYSHSCIQESGPNSFLPPIHRGVCCEALVRLIDRSERNARLLTEMPKCHVSFLGNLWFVN
jgi:hypothetical protein